MRSHAGTLPNPIKKTGRLNPVQRLSVASAAFRSFRVLLLQLPFIRGLPWPSVVQFAVAVPRTNASPSDPHVAIPWSITMRQTSIGSTTVLRMNPGTSPRVT
jgi:hypothetical protein